jgi:Ni/Fe-hydrogenase 1 B-type cytochrome subunit
MYGELPVRVFHWLNAFSILVLIATGLLISYPPAILSNAEASDIYWFGIVRTAHFIAAYVFVFAIIYRFYWAFVGNKFSRWSAYWPWTKKARENLIHVIKIDIFLFNQRKFDITNISIGHNRLAALAYIGFFLLFLVMIFTGFGIYQDTSGWWFPKLFAWVPVLLGGDFATRLVHHVTMWFIILIAIIHIYLVFYHEWLEGRGEVSSMFSGYKFVRKKRIQDDDEDLQDVGIDDTL